MLHLEGKFFESLRCLVLVCRDCISSSKFTIYQMRIGCSVWSSKYIVNTDDFMNPLPKGWSVRSIVWSIVLGEREEDSFIIINLSAKVVQYNLISKTLREIYDMGSNEIADDYLYGFTPPYAVYDVGYKKLDSFTLKRSQIRSLDSPAGLFVNHIRSSFVCDFESLDPRINSRKYTKTPSLLAPLRKLILKNHLTTKWHAFDYVYNLSTNLLKIFSEPDYANVDSNVYGCAGLRERQLEPVQ
nr:hypothetical protein [Tanacetum cinerariifolium]